MRNKQLLLISLSVFAACSANPGEYVDPMIGSATVGHCSPSAKVPMGSISVGPQSGNFTWEYTSGYQYADSLLQGFSQTHLNGTGCPDLGDLLIFPFCGEWASDNYESRYDKSTQKAEPGYYCVRLTDASVFAQMSATEHSSIMSFKFDNPAHARVLIDFQSNLCWSKESFSVHLKEAEQNFVSPVEISGWARSQIWVDRNYYYDIQFSEPYKVEKILPKRDDREVADRYELSFNIPEGRQLKIKLSISLNDVSSAAGNLVSEIPDWDFSKVKKDAKNEWNKVLNRIEIDGTKEQKALFYSALYRVFFHPDNIADAGEEPFYSTLSLWDTFRAEHPLLTILCPEKAGEIVRSMLNQYSKQGFLPIWTLCGIDNYCMIGNHSVPVIADAMMKGIGGFDYDEAYEAVKKSLTVPHLNSDWEIYDRYGYFPFDLTGNESTSRTLECAYDDWCAAQIAKMVGDMDGYNFFMKRSLNYKNVIDPTMLLARGKDSRGNWREPFNPYVIPGGGYDFHDFTEGNSWQYTWHVMQDIPGLIKMIGGEEEFCRRLDILFSDNTPIALSGKGVADVSGLIGQYAHGNEPSHHVAYLYELAGQPYKTEEMVNRIYKTLYSTGPDGLCGNDDCGQMSAWYVFSSIGFYPVNPCGGEYVLGAPQVPKAVIHLPSGKKFTVIAENYSPENIYVSDISLNGISLKHRILRHNEILEGGKLVFRMSSSASR